MFFVSNAIAADKYRCRLQSEYDDEVRNFIYEKSIYKSWTKTDIDNDNWIGLPFIMEETDRWLTSTVFTFVEDEGHPEGIPFARILTIDKEKLEVFEMTVPVKSNYPQKTRIWSGFCITGLN